MEFESEYLAIIVFKVALMILKIISSEGKLEISIVFDIDEERNEVAH